MLKKIVVFSATAFLMNVGAGFVTIHNDGGVRFETGLQVVNAAEKKEKRKKARKVPTISQLTYKKLSEVQELIDLKEYDQALVILDEMEARTKRYNGNEKGQIFNMAAFAWYAKDNNAKTIEYYQKVLGQGDDISEGLEISTLYGLAQLLFVEERYQASLDTMEIWLTKADNPGPNPHYFMGQVYYAMKDFPGAIDRVQFAIDMAQDRAMRVKENWWGLLRYLHFDSENWDRVIEILEILVREYPKRDYWIQLSGIYGQEGFDKKQVYAMEAAHVGGFLEREQDVVNYAMLLMQEEVPFRGAKWLQQGVDDEVVEANAKNLRTLGQAYQIAQEVDKAIPVLEEAGNLAEDGETYGRLAQLYLEKDEFEKCSNAAENALEKGIKRAYNTEIILGMCQFNRDRLTVARQTFVQARKNARSDKNRSMERMCGQWITYIDRERKRREELAKSI